MNAAERSSAPDRPAASPRESSSDAESIETSQLEARSGPADPPSSEPTIQPATKLQPEPTTGSEAFQASAGPLGAEPSGTASDAGPDQHLETASGSVEVPPPEPVEALPDSPAHPESLAEAPAIDAVASSDGPVDTQDADKTELTRTLVPDADPRHDPADKPAPEPAASTSDPAGTTSIESGPPEPPPALPRVEPVAQAAAEPGPESPGQHDQPEAEQPSKKGAAEAAKPASTGEPKPALRPEPVDRPTIVSSPSGLSAPPAAPPLPNPPPDSPSDDDSVRQGALFELDEPPAEYPG